MMNRDADPAQLEHSQRVAWTVGMVAAALIYVLTPGPVAWWIHHHNGGIEPLWVRCLYAPLIYGCEHLAPMGRAYEVYFDWCINLN